MTGSLTGRALVQYVADEFVASDQITSRHSLRLSALASTGEGPAISDGEAELLGWVMGDGSVASYAVRKDSGYRPRRAHSEVARENPGASSREIGRIVGCTHQTVGAYLRAGGVTQENAHERTGTGAMTRISLCQAKPNGVAAIDALLASVDVIFTEARLPPEGDRQAAAGYLATSRVAIAPSCSSAADTIT